MNVQSDDKPLDVKPTNPDDITGEEVAVALTYSPVSDQAPRVVAKGQGWLARQIIEVAEANGVEIRSDSDLALLLAQVDVDSEIPLEAFTVVAEMLSYIYEKNKEWPDGMGPKGKS
ncbi:MAG: EscU/YscU/HrcU family type III secretion system export apparatus switch protein [Magnetovibrio sp.]|nr:EscU/YscU/HrcU family type III secretion system export apparatus switch protein [Magnetovibrio sp.]